MSRRVITLTWADLAAGLLWSAAAVLGVCLLLLFAIEAPDETRLAFRAPCQPDEVAVVVPGTRDIFECTDIADALGREMDRRREERR